MNSKATDFLQFRDFLKQGGCFDRLGQPNRLDGFVTVMSRYGALPDFWNTEEKKGDIFSEKGVIYSFFAKKDSGVLDKTEWGELSTGHKVEFRHLAIRRVFDDRKQESYIEICEEFRLHFNLDEKREDKNNYALIDYRSGNNEEKVVLVQNNEVKIQLKYLSKFLYDKELCLVVCFDIQRFVDVKYKDEASHDVKLYKEDGSYIYEVGIGNEGLLPPWYTQAWIQGKKIIECSQDVGLYPEEQEVESLGFIVGVDTKTGEKIKKSVVEMRSNSNFYMTPIFFRREVLRRYYDEPSKYLVWCGGVNLRDISDTIEVCNDLPYEYGYVMIPGGRLWTIPSQERKHWYNYNIKKPDSDLPNISARFSHFHFGPYPELSNKIPPIESYDFYFRECYEKVDKIWAEKMGWHLFVSLHKDDKYLLDTLRIPITKEQLEFDTQVSVLQKLLVECLNANEMKKDIQDCRLPEKQRINILDQWLKQRKDIHGQDSGVVDFLKRLQGLRSGSTAHIKQKNKYEKRLQDMVDFLNMDNQINLRDNQDFQAIFSEMLIRSIQVLNYMRDCCFGK